MCWNMQGGMLDKTSIFNNEQIGQITLPHLFCEIFSNWKEKK